MKKYFYPFAWSFPHHSGLKHFRLVRHSSFFIFFICLFVGCSAVEENISEVEIDLADEEIRKIFNFRDRQEKDSLKIYFTHPDPVYRYLSALSFGSIQDTAYEKDLAPLLTDPADIVRSAAAFSIGQTGGEKAEMLLVEAFNNYDTSGYYKKANRAILEAVGKVGSIEILDYLSAIETYKIKDTTLLEGQAWGIYRFGSRGLISDKGTRRMIQIATNLNYPPSVRLIAANYLSRYEVNLDTFKNELALTFNKNLDPDIRMAMAIALGKANRPNVRDTLIANLSRETDYRVRCNILRALGNFDYPSVQPTILEYLTDENIHVAKRAAQFFIERGIPEDATFYRRKAKEINSWPIEIALLAASNRHLPTYYSDYRGLINYDLRRKFKQASSDYEKMAIFDAMAEYPWNYRTIYQFGKEDSSIVVQSSAIQALSKVSASEKFERFFGQSIRQISGELTNFFLEAIESGDVGKTAIAAIALRNPKRKFQNYLDSLTVLENTLSKLKLPQEVEAQIELQKTVDYFKNNKSTQPIGTYLQNPINWNLLDDISNKTRAAITTNKGTITVVLLPDVAPGTVANFIKLTRDKFFNGKNFHRVVPNFVIQGGCTRGDGYGALDYTIRSEFSPLHYSEEGFVGMASAGPHTEGTQFFITHSPTLHLDGRFTIFAKVVTEESMEVVHRIQPGDRIESVTIR